METIIKNCKKPKFITNIIKGLIFSVMMLAPFLAIATKCLYVINNRNANLSYSDDKIVLKTETLADTGTLAEGETYTFKFDWNKGEVNSTSIAYKYSSISIDWTDYGAPSGYNYNGFSIYKTANGHTYYLYLTQDNQNVYTFWAADETFGYNLTFGFTSSQNIAQNGKQPATLFLNTYKQETLDNVFYYAVQEATENPLFSWTQDTAIYTALNAMTTGLEIQGGFLPMLLAYWVLNTMIYLVMDIIIYSVNKLIEIISNKK